MSRSIRNRLITIFCILGACLYFTFPLEKNINLGLDLKGGMHLILRVDTSKIVESSKKEDAIHRAMEILRNRIDGLGVGETVIQKVGSDQILVQLPGITDRDKARDIVKRVAHLEFKMVHKDANALTEALKGNVPEGYELKKLKEDQSPILLEKAIALQGDAVSNAIVDFDQTGMTPKISLSFNSVGSKTFADITRNNIGNRLAILLDDEVMSAPVIRSAILNGNAEITGDYEYKEASLLALALRSGSLPAPLIVEEERTIGPLLGKDSISAGINATVISGILVLLFMVVYYRVAGLVSSLALIVNLFMIIGIMGFLNAMLPQSPLTLTLPGIAGIILTLGMAVDANVLINERIREELEDKRPLHGAISSGFAKAFKAIIDSNVTTLIAAFMLFQFGSGPIKGFAVTLSIGLVASLFTAIVVTKTLYELVYELGWIKTLSMMQIFKNANFNFVNKRYIAYGVSLVLVICGIFSVITKKNDAYGIDFVGGQIQEFQFNQPMKAQLVRDALAKSGINDVRIQSFQQQPENIIVRTTGEAELFDVIKKSFEENLSDQSFEVLRVEKVGPVVGKELRKRALYAIIFALAGILVFVGFRFQHFDFATAGIVALLHDVIVTAGVLVMMGKQIDLLVVTALLTIAGYSINDTIIIFDRVRENIKLKRKMSMGDLINLSVNQTLGRTVLTTATTLIVVVTLYLKGGEVLNTFALTLLIGFVAGTYSTIYIASPMVLAWQKRELAVKAKRK